MKCFYHSDADGQCAGFWVAEYAKRMGYDGCELYPINYGTPFPFDEIEKDELVYIVDYSIEPEEMDRLLDITPSVVWIDHHRTALAKYATYTRDIAGLRYDGIAGCLLTYCYVQRLMYEPSRSWSDETLLDSAPEFTKLISDYDVWEFKYGDRTRLFQIAFTAEALDPADTQAWWDILTDVDGMVAAGAQMEKFRNGWAKQYMSLGYEVEFEGYKCFACNLGNCNSMYFDSLTEGHDILIPFVFTGDQWKVSLYSKTVDVSEIAKKFGGGGHKGASGFECAKLPFTRSDT